MVKIKVYKELLEQKFKSLINFLHGKTGYAFNGNVDYIVDIDCQISLYQYEYKHKGGINPEAFHYQNKTFRLNISRIKKDHYS